MKVMGEGAEAGAAMVGGRCPRRWRPRRTQSGGSALRDPPSPPAARLPV